MNTTDNNSIISQLRQQIMRGRTAEVLELLQGSDPCKITDNKKSTLLHFAAEFDNKTFAQYLINLGADVNVQNREQKTPLMIAVERKSVETVDVLLKANADMCVPIVMKYSDQQHIREKCLLGRALNLLDQEIGEDIRRSLLNNIANESVLKSPYIKTRAFHDDCPLYYYEMSKHSALTKILLQSGCPVNAKHLISGRTALHEAVKRLNVDVVKLLVEYDADVNIVDGYGKTPISLIAHYDTEDPKMLEVFKILMDGGINLHDYHCTHLLSNGSRQFISMILQCNTNLYSKKNDDSKMLIEYIFENRNPGVYDELKKFEIDIDIRSSDGKTLLHRAAAKGNTSLVRLLLERRANANAKDNNGLTPLHMALDPIASYFDKPESEEKKRNRFRCIDLLLENGADPQVFTKRVDHGHPYNAMLQRYLPVKNLGFDLLTSVLSHLALQQVSGRMIEESALSKIEKQPKLQYTFDLNKRQLEEMKQVGIAESVNLVDFLVVKRVSIYAQNKELISNLSDIVKKYNTGLYYHRRLRERFLKLEKIVAINEIFVKHFNVLAVDIAEKIIDYL